MFVVSHFLILRSKVSLEWRLNPVFGTQKKCPFLLPLNRGVPSIEVINAKIMWTFFRDQILCPLNRGVPKKKFHYRLNTSKYTLNSLHKGFPAAMPFIFYSKQSLPFFPIRSNSPSTQRGLAKSRKPKYGIREVNFIAVKVPSPSNNLGDT